MIAEWFDMVWLMVFVGLGVMHFETAGIVSFPCNNNNNKNKNESDKKIWNNKKKNKNKLKIKNKRKKRKEQNPKLAWLAGSFTSLGTLSTHPNRLTFFVAFLLTFIMPADESRLEETPPWS